MALGVSTARKDLNRLRCDMVNTAIKTRFQQQWQWELVFHGSSNANDDANPPKDLSIYVKDITYGALEVETETKNVGAGVITMPVRSMPVELSMTVRDNQDRRVYNWMAAWIAKVINGSGHSPANGRATVNLESNYLRKCTRYQLIEENGQITHKKDDAREWEIFPTLVGDITESYEADGGLLEFPVRFVQKFSV
ncbi:hypothetical protein [Endozoicomonas lisbonensis]|uniref:Tail tube protein n=1 Tax=Endozoicomonas lisbonensis TaxID=3120522 RepID=A0ABV2SP89_9GAMM